MQNRETKFLILLCTMGLLMQTVRAQIVLEQIEFRDNVATKTQHLQKVIGSKVGDVLDSVRIAEDVQIVRQLPSVGHAYFQIDSLREDAARLVIYVQENKTIIPQIAVWTAVDQTAGRIGLSEANLLGSNKSIGAFYQNNKFNTWGLNFSDPYFFSRAWGLEISLLDWRSEEPLFFGNAGQANYKFRNQSAEVALLFRPSFSHRFRLAANPFRETYELLQGDVPDGIPTDLQLDKFLVKTAYEWNKVESYFFYLYGFKWENNLQFLVNEEEFVIYWINLSYYKRVREKGNLATRLRMGVATNRNSPFAPFALDNNINVRGVGNIIDRGTAQLVLNTEYRYALLDKEKIAIQSNVFFDFGTWRQPGGSFADFLESENMRIFSGVGARLILKRVFGATFRVDYGVNLQNPSRGGIVFGVGQYF